MARTIAISGKGGSGKTTIAAMMIRCLLERPGRNILAVDADPNSCLGLTMGIEPGVTVAQLREDALTQPAGSDRMLAFEYSLQQIITEAKGFDLLTMGRPEGPRCYCAVNNMLRTFLDRLGNSYSYVITDNEAGMEHLSRRTTNAVDWLIIVAEPTPVGKLTAGRIFALARSLPIMVKRIGVIWNRTEQLGQLDGPIPLGYVPYDETVLQASLDGKNIFDLGSDSEALSAVRDILDKKLNFN
jgi:CO dehydrogenase maturation factor